MGSENFRADTDETVDIAPSDAGTSHNDRLGMTQVKVDCSGCGEIVTHAEHADCKDCPAESQP